MTNIEVFMVYTRSSLREFKKVQDVVVEEGTMLDLIQLLLLKLQKKG